MSGFKLNYVSKRGHWFIPGPASEPLACQERTCVAHCNTKRNLVDNWVLSVGLAGKCSIKYVAMLKLPHTKYDFNGFKKSTHVITYSLVS